MFKNYFKSAFRATWKNRGVSIINVIGLSVGMTAAVFILLWVQNEMSYDNYHPDADNIYRITNTLQVSKTETWKWDNSPAQLAGIAKKEIPGVEENGSISPMVYNPFVFNIKNELFTEKDGAYVDKGWFNIFHYDFVEGNPANFFKDPFSLILTETKAKKYFGNHSAVGQVILIDTINYTVRGVIKDNPANSSFQYDVLAPLDAYLSNESQRKNMMSWNNFNILSFVQLHAGANPEAVSKKLTGVILQNKKDSNITCSLQPLKGMHFETGLQSSEILHADKKTVYIFSVLALLLILTACINYVNLTTARASLRAKEITIRKIVGAERKQLFMQFMAESILIGLISLCITLLLIKLLLPLYNQLTEKNFVLPLTSPDMWKVLGATLIFSTLLNGIYPATLLSSFNPLSVFRGVNILRVKDSSLRKGLVVFQFTLSVMLIISTIVVFKQLNYIQHTNPGYERSQIISLQVPHRTHTKLTPGAKESLYTTLQQTIMRKSGIEDVTLASQPIVNLTSMSTGAADWDGRPADFDPAISNLSVDDHYQNVFKLQLLQGQWFKPGAAGKHGFILNETAVQQLNIHKPVIGQRFVFHGDTGNIIGVVKDFHYKSMHEKIGPVVMFNDEGWRSYLFIKTAPGNVAASLQATEAAWKALLPGDPFNYVFLDDTFNSLYKSDLKVSSLILLFSVIVVIISALGLFALAAFTAEQRTKEIGIRKVLGATVPNITFLLSKDFVKLVLLSVIIASPIAWWAMSKWLEDFAYRVTISWWIFIVAGAAALFIALATISYQAIKSALANPVRALRSE